VHEESHFQEEKVGVCPMWRQRDVYTVGVHPTPGGGFNTRLEAFVALFCKGTGLSRLRFVPVGARERTRLV
jgi:hypothetical protein